MCGENRKKWKKLLLDLGGLKSRERPEFKKKVLFGTLK